MAQQDQTRDDSQAERQGGGGASPGPAAGKSQSQEPMPTSKPSQAEGDRETIEESLRQKEAEGQI